MDHIIGITDADRTKLLEKLFEICVSDLQIWEREFLFFIIKQKQWLNYERRMIDRIIRYYLLGSGQSLEKESGV